jgi:hypothetical protein
LNIEAGEIAMKIDPKEGEKIEQFIRSDDSPVGIDAKKTHVYIIQMLHKIDRRLAALEDRVAKAEQGSHWR